jgi:hypothetical protein
MPSYGEKNILKPTFSNNGFYEDFSEFLNGIAVHNDEKPINDDESSKGKNKKK